MLWTCWETNVADEEKAEQELRDANDCRDADLLSTKEWIAIKQRTQHRLKHTKLQPTHQTTRVILVAVFSFSSGYS